MSDNIPEMTLVCGYNSAGKVRLLMPALLATKTYFLSQKPIILDNNINEPKQKKRPRMR